MAAEEKKRVQGLQGAKRGPGTSKEEKRTNVCCFSSLHYFVLEKSLPSASFHKPLILIHERAERKKTTITEN